MKSQESMQDKAKNSDRRSGLGFVLGWVLAVVAGLALLVVFVFARDSKLKEQSQQLQSQANAGERVLVRHIVHSGGAQSFDLPATVHGYIETSLYAKIAGYLKEIRVDKGDKVRKGQVLAVLESPELEQQVANARASYELDAITDRRNQQLVKEGVVAQQAADETHNTMLAAKATLDEMLANEAYKTITAPFDGVITSRPVDPGALIPQATSGSSNLPLLTIATLSPVRIYADMPQAIAPFIRDGDAVTLTVADYPGRVFKGEVTRHPQALADATRTMLTEVDLPNRDHALLPGMYATMHIRASVSANALLVPDDALVFRDGKPYVPIVRADQLHLVPVNLGQDDGNVVEVSGELVPSDLVAVNVGQSAHDGEKVQAVMAEQ